MPDPGKRAFARHRESEASETRRGSRAGNNSRLAAARVTVAAGRSFIVGAAAIAAAPRPRAGGTPAGVFAAPESRLAHSVQAFTASWRGAVGPDCRAQPRVGSAGQSPTNGSDLPVFRATAARRGC